MSKEKKPECPPPLTTPRKPLTEDKGLPPVKQSIEMPPVKPPKKA
jgi:hypothetical protein